MKNLVGIFFCCCTRRAEDLIVLKKIWHSDLNVYVLSSQKSAFLHFVSPHQHLNNQLLHVSSYLNLVVPVGHNLSDLQRAQYHHLKVAGSAETEAVAAVQKITSTETHFAALVYACVLALGSQKMIS
jgi:hypothetical protein